MLGVGLNMIAPGIPMLFQGEEFVTYAAFDFPVPPPIDWGLAAANAGIVQEVWKLLRVVGLSVVARAVWTGTCHSPLAGSIFQFPSSRSPHPTAISRPALVHQVADMVALRRNLNGTTAGLLGAGAKTLLVVNTATEKLAVIHRFGTDGGDVVAIVNMYQTNLSGYTVPFPLDGTWEVRFNGDDTKYSSQVSGRECVCWGRGVGRDVMSGSVYVNVCSHSLVLPASN